LFLGVLGPKIAGHLEKYSLEAGRSAIEVAVVSVSGLMGAGLSSRLFEAATRAIGKTI
jgi:predicted dinucleotide-utilizing enzyme